MTNKKQSELNLRYQGFLETPFLFKYIFNGLHPLILKNKTKNHSFNNIVNNEPRLGKLVEYFVFNELIGIKSVNVLKTNIQIIKNKITIGEIDALIKHINKVIHLEIIYKFYLYDNLINTSEINKWIGPNRNDSLSKKLNKLKTKQFPLLFNKETILFLSTLGLDANLIHQRIYFKAQLFVPKQMNNYKFDYINNLCIKGYYLSLNEVQELPSSTLFYIPKKLDWIIDPHSLVKWMTHKQFLETISSYLTMNISPLCWIKKGNQLSKIFIVYWR